MTRISKAWGTSPSQKVVSMNEQFQQLQKRIKKRGGDYLVLSRDLRVAMEEVERLTARQREINQTLKSMMAFLKGLFGDLDLPLEPLEALEKKVKNLSG